VRGRDGSEREPNPRVKCRCVETDRRVSYSPSSNQTSSTVPRSVSLYLTSPGKTPTFGAVDDSSALCSNSTVTQTYSAEWPPPVPLTFQVGACVRGTSLSSAYVASDQCGIFQLAYVLTPANATVHNLSLSLEVRPSVAPFATPELVDESSVLSGDQIRWVVPERNLNQIILQRFMDDLNYSLYRTTPDYLVLTA
jgi:hypothetical protein